MKTKLIPVWHVEFAAPIPTITSKTWRPEIYVCRSYASAKVLVAEIGTDAWPKACATITGPHQHRVPA